MYWTLAALGIFLRTAAAVRTQHKAFRWFLIFTMPCEIALFVLGWTHRPGSFAYDYAWRTYEIAALAGLAVVTWEAVTFGCISRERHHIRDPDRSWWQHGNRQCHSSALPLPERHGSPSPGIGASHREHMRRTMLVPFLGTASFLFFQHHIAVWPGYWLEPVFWAICATTCFLGLSIIAGRRWTPHSAILCSWLLFQSALYSGASLSIKQVGVAGEILNCVAFGAWAVM